jgi:hypothetical protein
MLPCCTCTYLLHGHCVQTTFTALLQQYISPDHAKKLPGNSSQGPVYKIYVRGEAIRQRSRQHVCMHVHSLQLTRLASMRGQATEHLPKVQENAPFWCVPPITAQTHAHTQTPSNSAASDRRHLATTALCAPHTSAVFHGAPARVCHAEPRHDDLWYVPAPAQAWQEWRARPGPVQGERAVANCTST